MLGLKFQIIGKIDNPQKISESRILFKFRQNREKEKGSGKTLKKKKRSRLIGFL